MDSAPESDPGASPMVLETLATTGGTPNANRVGKVIKVPAPTTVLIRPAAAPAPPRASSSSQVTAACWARSPAGPPDALPTRRQTLPPAADPASVVMPG